MSHDCNINPNSVDIPIDEPCGCYFCAHSGFVTTYPDQLRNHIGPLEFQESITNINNHFPKCFFLRKCCIAICMLIPFGFMFLGISIFLQSEFIQGIFFIIIGILICCPCCWCMMKDNVHMQPVIDAIQEESRKYEARNCKWRMIAKRHDPNLLEETQQIARYHIIIDIIQPNGNESMPPSYFELFPPS